MYPCPSFLRYGYFFVLSVFRYLVFSLCMSLVRSVVIFSVRYVWIRYVVMSFVRSLCISLFLSLVRSLFVDCYAVRTFGITCFLRYVCINVVCPSWCVGLFRSLCLHVVISFVMYVFLY